MKTVKYFARAMVLSLAAGLLAIAPAAAAGAITPPARARPVLGTAVLDRLTGGDSQYSNMVLTHYHMITPENATKWSVIEPQRGVFNFAPMDALVDFATQHHLQVQGMPLVWWTGNPSWLTGGNFSSAEMSAILENHIRTVVSRYAGRVAIWDVVSEAVGFNVPNPFNGTIGPAYLDIAYRTARAADPRAKLYYNDMGGEIPSWRQTLALNMVSNLKARGVPLDGMGLEMHTTTSKIPVGAPLGATNSRPSAGQIGRTMRTYAKLGLEVAITEMDVRLYGPVTAKALKDQAKVYSQIYRVCIKAPNCTSLTTWGFTDRYSWVSSWTGGAAGTALPFDRNYAPKPAAHVFFG